MSTKLAKHSTTISFLFLVAMLTAACLYPTSKLLFGIILLLSFVILSFAVLEEYREAYLHDTFPRVNFARKASIDILSVLLTLVVAGVLGWYIVHVVTAYMNQGFAKFVMATTISLIAGAMTGLLIRRITRHWIKTS